MKQLLTICIIALLILLAGVGVVTWYYIDVNGVQSFLRSEQGADGTAWLSGEDSPVTALGRAGDFYLNITTYDLYLRSAEGWAVIGNIRGTDGVDGVDGIDGTHGQDGIDGQDAIGAGALEWVELETDITTGTLRREIDLDFDLEDSFMLYFAIYLYNEDIGSIVEFYGFIPLLAQWEASDNRGVELVVHGWHWEVGAVAAYVGFNYYFDEGQFTFFFNPVDLSGNSFYGHPDNEWGATPVRFWVLRPTGGV
jgi:hypothetical protein